MMTDYLLTAGILTFAVIIAWLTSEHRQDGRRQEVD